YKQKKLEHQKKLQKDLNDAYRRLQTKPEDEREDFKAHNIAKLEADLAKCNATIERWQKTPVTETPEHSKKESDAITNMDVDHPTGQANDYEKEKDQHD